MIHTNQPLTAKTTSSWRLIQLNEIFTKLNIIAWKPHTKQIVPREGTKLQYFLSKGKLIDKNMQQHGQNTGGPDKCPCIAVPSVRTQRHLNFHTTLSWNVMDVVKTLKQRCVFSGSVLYSLWPMKIWYSETWSRVEVPKLSILLAFGILFYSNSILLELFV